MFDFKILYDIPNLLGVDNDARNDVHAWKILHVLNVPQIVCKHVQCTDKCNFSFQNHIYYIVN